MQIDDSMLNETFYEDKDGTVSALKTENQMLRELNTELKHKTLLLNELITKDKERPSTFRETYADITSKKIHIAHDINQRNFPNLDKKGKILSVSSNGKNSKSTVIMEVINVKPCYNCGRFSHNGKKCKNNPACLIIY